MKYSNVTLGRVEAVWNKLGGSKGVDSFLKNKSVTSPELGHVWKEDDNIIYFSVESGGRTGADWYRYFDLRDDLDCVDGLLSNILHTSSAIQPSTGVISVVAVIRGSNFAPGGFTLEAVHERARALNFKKPNSEVACLIREKITNETMTAMNIGHITVMHDPITVSGSSYLLGAHRYFFGGLSASRVEREFDGINDFFLNGGYAFVVSQMRLGPQ